MFTIDRKTLLEAVLRVMPAAGTATGAGYSLPALRGVLFVHTPTGALRLETTNGEQRAETNLFTTPGEAFERLADGKSVVDALRAQTSVTFVEVAPDGPGLRIGGVTVPGLSMGDWIKQPDSGVMVGQLRAQSFLEVLARVVLAMSKDTARPSLNSIAVVPDDRAGMRLQATNSYWLAQVDVPHARIGGEEPYLLPAKAVAALLKLLKGAKGTVSLRLAKGTPFDWLWFKHPLWTFATILTSSPFPNVGQLIGDPDSGDALVVDLDELRAVVDEARKLKAERMELNLNHEIEVASFGGVGNVRRVIRGSFAGEARTVALSPEYLAGALKVVPDAAIRLREGLKPLSFWGKGAIAILMPIRVPERPTDPDQGPEAVSEPERKPVRYETSTDDPYMHPVESDGDAEEEALGEVVGDDDDPADETQPVTQTDEGEELTYIGRHAFRELGWQPDLEADGWECCTCEEVVTWTEVEHTHRCWMPEKID
jgi:DNA polymerase III beta subunit, central domain